MNNMSFFSKKEVLIDNNKLKKTVKKSNILDCILSSPCNCGMKYLHTITVLKKSFCGHNSREDFIMCYCCEATEKLLDDGF